MTHLNLDEKNNKYLSLVSLFDYWRLTDSIASDLCTSDNSYCEPCVPYLDNCNIKLH